MSISTFFTQSITVQRTTGITRDAIGEAFIETETETGVMGYVEPVLLGSGEDTLTRDTLYGDWYAYVPIDTDVTGWDRLLVGAHTFDIVAPPQEFIHPRTSSIDHIRLRLREIT